MHLFKGESWGDHARYLVAILCKTLGLFLAVFPLSELQNFTDRLKKKIHTGFGAQKGSCRG